MPLIECNECGKDISSQSTKCTNCGAQTKAGKMNQIAMVIVVAIVVGAAMAFFLEKL